MQEKTIEDRRMAKEKFMCPHCGLKFRYIVNRKAHEKKCVAWYYSPNKYKEEMLLLES